MNQNTYNLIFYRNLVSNEDIVGPVAPIKNVDGKDFVPVFKNNDIKYMLAENLQATEARVYSSNDSIGRIVKIDNRETLNAVYFMNRVISTIENFSRKR